MTPAEWVASGQTPFTLPGATRFQRLRARHIPDETNPAATMTDWSNPDAMDFHGALASSSSTRIPDGLDDQTTSTAYLTVDDPDVDIRVGDRIRAVPTDGRTWEVSGVPSRDVNAFTGWRPTAEIPLTEWKG